MLPRGRLEEVHRSSTRSPRCPQSVVFPQVPRSVLYGGWGTDHGPIREMVFAVLRQPNHGPIRAMVFAVLRRPSVPDTLCAGVPDVLATCVKNHGPIRAMVFAVLRQPSIPDTFAQEFRTS